VEFLFFQICINVDISFDNCLSSLQLCVWSTDGWEKQASKVLQMPTGRGAAPLADTRVQFHLDQIDLLVVHETQIAIYEAPKLECLNQVLKVLLSCTTRSIMSSRLRKVC